MTQGIQLRFIVAWQAYRRGDIITPMSKMQADWLIGQGFCERVEDVPNIEHAVTGPTECATAIPTTDPPPRKRGRPKGSRNKKPRASNGTNSDN